MLSQTVSSKIQLAMPRPLLDGPVIFKLLNNHRQDFQYYLPWIESIKSSQDEINLLKEANQKFSNSDAVSLNLVIWYEKQIAGMISFNFFDLIRSSADIGYWLSPEFRGHGIVTKAVKGMCDLGFQDFGFNRIVIKIAVDNKMSNAVAKRAGFTLEGILRQNERLDDGYHDENIYSLLRKEWK